MCYNFRRETSPCHSLPGQFPVCRPPHVRRDGTGARHQPECAKVDSARRLSEAKQLLHFRPDALRLPQRRHHPGLRGHADKQAWRGLFIRDEHRPRRETPAAGNRRDRRRADQRSRHAPQMRAHTRHRLRRETRRHEHGLEPDHAAHADREDLRRRAGRRPADCRARVPGRRRGDALRLRHPIRLDAPLSRQRADAVRRRQRHGEPESAGRSVRGTALREFARPAPATHRRRRGGRGPPPHLSRQRPRQLSSPSSPKWTRRRPSARA